MTAVLVDTSVWRKYFSGRIGATGAEVMSELLDQDDGVLSHPAVIGELVLGGLAVREEALLRRLPAAAEIASPDMLAFVRTRKLVRKGIGWVDCQLLASSLVVGARLWSLDRQLASAAGEVGVAFDIGGAS